MAMFPRIFETSVYTQQETIRPLDLMINPHALAHTVECVHCMNAFYEILQSNDSRKFSEESCNPPVHVPGPSSARPPSHPTPEELQVSRRDASNFKLNRKATRDVTPGRPLAKCPPKTILGAKRRRRPATFFCTVPGCSSDFTTKHRLESHLKGVHLGIKDLFCRRCSYKTAYHSDLVRHIKLNHKRHATKGLTQLDDQR